MLQAGFRALEQSELIARTRSAPSRTLIEGPVAHCRVQHSTTVAGAAPDFTGFPNSPARQRRAGTFSKSMVLDLVTRQQLAGSEPPHTGSHRARVNTARQAARELRAACVRCSNGDRCAVEFGESKAAEGLVVNAPLIAQDTNCEGLTEQKSLLGI
jgi:hypothetical protein